MNAYQTDSRIDDYIAMLAFLAAGDVPPGARAGARRRPGGDRDHQALQATLFYAQGNICARLRAKGHLNIFIYDPLVPDPEGLITRDTGTGQHGRFKSGRRETINQRVLLHLFQAIIAHNRTGGWRKLQGSQ